MGTRSGYAMVDETDPQFCRWWAMYPKRVSKKDARKAWAKANPTPALVDEMIAALTWQVPHHRWDGEKYEYAPFPATWLNKERWKDAPPPQVKQRALSQAVSDPIQAWLQQKVVGS